MIKRLIRLSGIGGSILVFILSACTTIAPGEFSQEKDIASSSTPNAQVNINNANRNSISNVSTELDRTAEIDRLEIQQEKIEPSVRIYPGTGRFIDIHAAKKSLPPEQGSGNITLNFEGAGIQEVVKVVFDILQENYVIDPTVQGKVTIQTTRPLTKDMLMPTLEMLLRMNNATLVRAEGIYKVVPVAKALSGSVTPRLSNVPQGSGYSVRIVPLRYVSAVEMQKILAPFIPESGILQVDTTRNLLMLAGTPRELATLQETIDIFDVNWLKGMSIGVYKLRNADSQTVATELDNIFGKTSQLPLAGMFRFVPVSQLNAVLVITSQAEYLKEAGRWVERLDGSGGERLYVYPMQNGRADYVASILNEVFGGAAAGKPPAPRVAPGLQPAGISTPGSEQGRSASPSAQAAESSAKPTSQSPTANSAGAAELAIGMEPVRVIADTENNTLLIWASEQNYEKIVAALQKIDISPRQVLVEATIAEVTLTGELRYGLQWFFKHDAGKNYTATGSFDLGSNVPLEDVLGNGFSYALTDGAGIVKALLNTLASESKLRVLSSPQVMVIDNQEAEIRVGTQQPVLTSTTITDGGNTVQSIQYKDTGVILTVRPQINVGGLVMMDLKQEVTDVGQVDTATGQRAFQQRSVSSRVAIQSGQTIVLGGLIRDREDNSQRGVPGLYKLPVVGPLFGSESALADRTELIVLITPRVLQNSLEVEQITEELRRKMKNLAPITAKGWGS